VRWLRFPRLLGLIACLYLMAMAVLFGYHSVQNYRFVHDAARTTGTVVAFEARPPAGETRTARDVTQAPRVRYEVAGRTYEYTAAHGTYRPTHRLGDQIVVLYDPADPSKARLRGEGQLMVPLITSGFATAALLVGFVLFRTRHLGPPQNASPATAARPDRVAAGR
jgi:hypothetical protein